MRQSCCTRFTVLIAIASAAAACASDPAPASIPDGALPGTDAAADTAADAGVDTAQAPCTAGFELVWRDEFDTWNPARWGTATHTFDENDAQFDPGHVNVTGGRLVLNMTANTGATKPYLSGEARTLDSFLYGKIETKAKFAKGSGLISSLFLFYDAPDYQTNWNEIDVEYLGRYPDRIQYNTILAPGVKTDEFLYTTTFDPSADFHVYTVEWYPDRVRFLIDGAEVRVATKWAAGLSRPQKIMMNLWPSKSVAWAGAIDATAASAAQSEYEYVEYSRCK